MTANLRFVKSSIIGGKLARYRRAAGRRPDPGKVSVAVSAFSAIARSTSQAKTHEMLGEHCEQLAFCPVSGEIA